MGAIVTIDPIDVTVSCHSSLFAVGDVLIVNGTPMQVTSIECNVLRFSKVRWWRRAWLRVRRVFARMVRR